MSAAVITADVDVDLLDDPQWIFDCKVPQLKAAWKQLDQSGFEPASNKHLRLEPIKRAHYKAFTAEQVSASALDEDETPLPSPSVSATKASTPSSKSYKEAVITVQGSAPVDLKELKEKLVQLEVMVKSFQKKFTTIEQKAEADRRKQRECSLVFYNIPEMLQRQEDVDAVCTLVEGTLDIEVSNGRLGTHSPEQGRARPTWVNFCYLGRQAYFSEACEGATETGCQMG